MLTKANEPSCLCLFVFNSLPTAKVIWRRGHSFKSYLTDQRNQGSNLPALVYKASSLSTTIRRLLTILFKNGTYRMWLKIFLNSLHCGAQWLSGRVLDSQEPLFMSLSKTLYPLLSNGSTPEDRKHSNMTEKLLTASTQTHSLHSG